MLLRLARFFVIPHAPKANQRSNRARLGRGGRLESRVLLSVFTPAQIMQAYGFNQIKFTAAQGTSVLADGKGQTIAIVDAYGDPTIAHDLSVFDAKFALPAAPLQTVTPQGQLSVSGGAGWASETALDVEWAHAVAPGANLLLVEAASASVTSLVAAVDYARQQTGVVAVSMSWGMNEWPGETALDSTFTTPSGHIGGSSGLPGAPDLPGGVTFVAATGDRGGSSGLQWPAVSPNVVGVGGTSLSVLNSAGKYEAETAWSYGGGGISWYESEPAYQRSVQSTGFRTSPDVALNANGANGFYVYASGAWVSLGGTSAATAVFAGLVALADQQRALRGLGSLDGPTQTLPALYAGASTAYSANFNDIVTGSNGYKASRGYDLATGLGSPHANTLVSTLAAAPTVVTTTTGTVIKSPAPLGSKLVTKTSGVATVSFVELPSDAPGSTLATVTIPLAAVVNAARGSVFLVPNAVLTVAPPTVSPVAAAPVAAQSRGYHESTDLLAMALRQLAADQALFSPTFGSLDAAPLAPSEETAPPAPEKPKAPPANSDRPSKTPEKTPAAVRLSDQEVDAFWSHLAGDEAQSDGQIGSVLESGSPLGAALLLLCGYQFSPAPGPETEEQPRL